MSIDSGTAAVAGLTRSDPHGPGITRRRGGDGFRYLDPAGSPVTDAAELARIRALTLPPAWTRVWISPDPLGHIQATGVDSRGRTQYRYHPVWREQRDAQKFAHMLRFAGALPERLNPVRQTGGFRLDLWLSSLEMLRDHPLLGVGLDVQTSLALFDRIFEYLDQRIDIEEKPDALAVGKAGDVVFDGVWFRYDEDWTLQDVSFTVPAGTTTALVGETGSGKTTLGYLAARLYDTSRGRITIGPCLVCLRNGTSSSIT